MNEQENNTVIMKTLDKMRVSPIVNDAFILWKEDSAKSNPQMFEDIVRFCIDNGFKPSLKDRRKER